MDNIGDRIRYLRELYNLTQQQFSDKSGVQRGNMSRYEKNQVKPSADAIIAICQHFGVSADWLLTGKEPTTKSDVQPLLSINPTEELHTLGERIRYLRTERGLSMAALGKYIDASSSNISDWENDKTSPSSKALLSLSQYFNVSADWILTGKEYATITERNRNDDILRDLTKEEMEEVKNYAGYLLWLREFKNKSKSGDEASQKSPIIPFPVRKNNDNDEAAAKDDLIKEDAEVYLPVLGTSAAGTPILVNEILEGYVPVKKKDAKNRAFLVRAQGDSMICAGIQNGDLVVVRPQPIVENGEIALVRVCSSDSESTIKFFYKYDDHILLKPANPEYEPIFLSSFDEITVVGKIVDVIKKDDAASKMTYLDT